jgi:ribosomal protein S14
MDSKGIRPEKLDLCKKCGKMFLKTQNVRVCPSCLEQRVRPSWLGQEYLPLFDEEFKRPHGLETPKKSESTKEIPTKGKDKKWSRKFDHCVKCGRNDVEHLARGLCRYCYDRETAKRGRGNQRIAYGLASQKLSYKYLSEEYVNKKRSLSDIAKDCDCGRQYVYKKMKEFNIPLRNQKEARTEAIKKNKFERFGYYEINENFFSEWSTKMAWVLGLLFTDGWIRPSSISIWSMDMELLEKMKKALNTSKAIGITTQSYDKSKRIHTFAFYREQMMSDLNRLGLHQRKSHDMVFPDVPEEYMRHFIRGCWDGDGSIFVSRGKLRGSYVCGSLTFIKRLVQELYKAGIYRIRPPYSGFPLTIHKSKRSDSYEIKIDSRENLEKLFNYFYDGVDESMYLERKFKTLAKGLGIITDGLQEI